MSTRRVWWPRFLVSCSWLTNWSCCCRSVLEGAESELVHHFIHSPFTKRPWLSWFEAPLCPGDERLKRLLDPPAVNLIKKTAAVVSVSGDKRYNWLTQWKFFFSPPKNWIVNFFFSKNNTREIISAVIAKAHRTWAKTNVLAGEKEKPASLKWRCLCAVWTRFYTNHWESWGDWICYRCELSQRGLHAVPSLAGICMHVFNHLYL